MVICVALRDTLKDVRSDGNSRQQVPTIVVNCSAVFGKSVAQKRLFPKAAQESPDHSSLTFIRERRLYYIHEDVLAFGFAVEARGVATSEALINHELNFSENTSHSSMTNRSRTAVPARPERSPPVQLTCCRMLSPTSI